MYMIFFPHKSKHQTPMTQDLCQLDVFYHQLYSSFGSAYWNEYSDLPHYEKSMEHAISTRRKLHQIWIKR